MAKVSDKPVTSKKTKPVKKMVRKPKPKPLVKVVVKSSAGAPTKYKEAYNDQAYKLCLLGVTDKDLAVFFEVNDDTIYEWKKKHTEFSEAVKKGKQIADAEVASSFYNRAKGFTVPSEKIFQSEGMIIRADTNTYYPPDAGAALNWLKNRQPDKWRDKQEIDHTTEGGKLNVNPVVNVVITGALARSEKDVDV